MSRSVIEILSFFFCSDTVAFPTYRRPLTRPVSLESLPFRVAPPQHLHPGPGPSSLSGFLGVCPSPGFPTGHPSLKLLATSPLSMQALSHPSPRPGPHLGLCALSICRPSGRRAGGERDPLSVAALLVHFYIFLGPRSSPWSWRGDLRTETRPRPPRSLPGTEVRACTRGSLTIMTG